MQSNPFQTISLLVGTIGGLVAAFIAIYQAVKNREQREIELRWRQANVGKQILDEMFNHRLAANACLMFDWRKREYEIKKDICKFITYDDVLSALAKERTEDVDDKETFIRECFDYFFYFVDRIQHFININLINVEDVDEPLRRYAEKINGDKVLFRKFIDDHKYELAIKFFEQYGPETKTEQSAR